MMDQGHLPGFDELVIDEQGISPEEARRISAGACEAFEERLLGNDALLPLADGYLNARARGWDWRKSLYIAWARLPRDARWPKTLAELAVVLGLQSDRTIRRWRYANPEIDRLVQEEMLTRVSDRTADVLEALAQLASQPDYKSTRAMELYLRVHGIYTPEQTVHADVTAAQVYLPETAALDEASDEDGDVET